MGKPVNTLEIMEIGKTTLIVFFKVAMPVMSISLIVGLVISLFQALTQIQEQTLTFVPKIFLIFLSLIFLMPFMITTMTDFSNELNRKIVEVGRSDDD